MRQCLGLFEAEKNRLMVFMIIFFSKIDAYVLTKTGNCSDVTQVSRARSLSPSLSFSLSLPPSPPLLLPPHPLSFFSTVFGISVSVAEVCISIRVRGCLQTHHGTD